jgi:Na+-driven multidrug efflux pump
MVVSVVSMWLFRVAFAYVLAQDTVSVFNLFSFPGFGMGVIGVWIAMFADWIVRTLFFLWRFLSGKWLTKAQKI